MVTDQGIEIEPAEEKEIVEEPAAEETQEAAAPIEPEKVVEPAAPAAAAYTPSYKYKVRDEEHAMDDWVKGMVKDAETEKKFQDLYTRQHGLKIAKEERDQFKGELGQLKESLSVVNEFVNKRDARSFIKALNLDPKMFIDYAIEELKYEQMPPEQRQYIDAQRQQSEALQQLQAQNQYLASNYEKVQTQQRHFELDSTLGHPEIQSRAQSYDAMVGRPGAFRNLVIERGVYHAHLTGADIPVNQAVNEVLQILGGVQMGNQQTLQNGMGTLPAGQAQAQIQTPGQQTKPVIPNIQGQGTASPAKKMITSIADLRKKQQELSAAGL